MTDDTRTDDHRAAMTDDLRAELAEHRAILDASEALLPVVAELADRIGAALARGGKLIAFGNGGSAADAQHLAAELVGRYREPRRPWPAIALASDPSVVTAVANDFGFEEVFARQLEAHVRPGDVAVAFTTSGRSENIVRGLGVAKQLGATTVLLAGASAGPAGGSAASGSADLVIAVPSHRTPRIQEVHGLVIHLVCERLERLERLEGRSGYR